MVGSKPNSYVSEEVRLEAQRRMLAERYGLLSDDDSDDNQNPTNGVPTPNGQPASANGRNPHPVDDPAPSDAATYGEGSSIHDSDPNFAISQDEPFSDPHGKPPQDDHPAGWPGVEIIDSSAGNRIRARYQYSLAEAADVSQRNLKVTPITVYTSQFLERHERKIAVNDHIITYAVGGHIRAILRNSSDRSLLKGHDSSVADVEFLSTAENRIEPSIGENISILGSVADDGSVYVWKIVRNDSASQDTLAIADAIRFEHPDYEKGKSYRRIAFRPGPNSIIAENGIGVAMLLLDGEATDLRVVEVVKMNDKMMVRDKFLKARNEIADQGGKAEGCIDAATWLSERFVVTSRGGHVFLWNADSTFSSCIARIPREKTTRVTGLHALKHDVLLLVVEAGRELEIWVTSDLMTDSNSTSLTLSQTIRLFPEDAKDVFCVASVDPNEELVMLTNVKGNSFFALHYNQQAKAFDTVTEVPVKQTILSFCTTRKVSKPAISPTSTIAPPENNSSSSEELHIWCVQSRGIQLIHLPSKDCSPRSTIISEVHPKPVSKTFTRKIEKIPPTLIAQTLPSTPISLPSKPKDSSSSSSSVPTPSKRIPRSLGSIKNRAASAVPPRPTSEEPTNKSAKGVENAISTISTTAAANRKEATPSMETKTQTTPAPPTIPNNNTKNTPSQTASPPRPLPSPTSDEVADAILSAAKKVIHAFEEGASLRHINEKAKMERLIDSVTETAESNLERYVNASMKKAVSDHIVPGMSQIVSNYRKAMKQSMQASSKVTTEHFERVIDLSSINKSFSSACEEMTRQVSTAVADSMTSKYESLIKPTVDIVNDATQDISTSVTQLRGEVSRFKPGELGAERPSVVELQPEDVRRSIDDLVAAGDIDNAFLTALDKEDLGLVTWLCRKFDSGSFFETYRLSQTAMLSLAHQLGHGLLDDDVEFKVDWLRELMIVLDPEAEDIESISVKAVQGLVDNVNSLKQNRTLLAQHDGLEKKLRTLGLLITSHIPK